LGPNSNHNDSRETKVVPQRAGKIGVNPPKFLVIRPFPNWQPPFLLLPRTQITRCHYPFGANILPQVCLQRTIHP